MTKQILAICLAATGFGGLLESNAVAREAANPVQTEVSAVAALPNTAQLDATIVLEEGHRRHYRHHRHYHRRRHYHHRYHRHGHYYYR